MIGRKDKTMQTIHSYDKDGNKIKIRYEQEVIKEKEPETDIVIDSYGKFKMCLRRSQEEAEYTNGCGDMRYQRALADLVRNDHAKYEEYFRKLRDEFNGK